MSIEDAVRRAFEAVGVAPRNVDVADEVFDPDFRFISPGWPETAGRENFKRAVTPMFAALSDFKVTVEEMIGEDDQVAARWTNRVTTKAPLPLGNGVTVPAGKTLTWTTTGFFRVRDGKVLEERAYTDWLAVLRQVGAMPAGPSSAGRE